MAVSSPPTALVVFRDFLVGNFIETTLADDGFVVHMAMNHAEAVLAMDGRHFDVLFLDVASAAEDKFALARIAQSRLTPLVLCTTNPKLDHPFLDAVLLVKPFSYGEIRLTAKAAMAAAASRPPASGLPGY